MATQPSSFAHALRERADSRTLAFELALVVVGVVEMASYAFSKLYFDEELATDVSGVWLPFANAVLDGGAPYLAHWDNKPPLFHFLNIAFAATDHYVLVFFITIGVANGVAAILLWRLCRQYGYGRIGLVAAVVFIGAMAHTSWRINPRQYATVFILLALLTSKPGRSGLYVACAGLLSQFSVFIIPAVLWLRYRARDLTSGWFVRFVAAGLVTVAATFGIIAAVWSPEAAIAGFRYSFFASSEYIGGYGQREISLYSDPIGWPYNAFKLLREWGWMTVALGGAAGAGAVVMGSQYNRRGFGVAMVLAVLGLAFQTTIRPAPVYTLAWLPFAVVLAVMAADTVLTGGAGGATRQQAPSGDS